MPEIQLKKPLYKSTSSPATAAENAAGGPPPPRAPKPSLVARVGAVFLDALVLHGALLLIIRLMPEATVALGWAGPAIGLFIGCLYLAICGSHLCLGRTLGKLIMRIQLCDVAGPDLPVSRSSIRAALLISPLALFIVSGYFSERFEQPDELVSLPFLQVMTPLVAIGWLVANVFHAAFEPYGRTVYDRIVHSVVINADPDPDQLHEYLRGARTPLSQQEQRKPQIAFAVMAALFLTIGGAQYIQFSRYARELSPVDRSQVLAQRRAFHVAGFGQPAPVAPEGQRMIDNSSTSTQEMEVAAFEYRRRAPFTAEEVRANPEAISALDRVIEAHSGPEFQDRLFAHLNELNKKLIMRGEKPTTAPQRLKFEITFAEHADLFFARQSFPVLTETRTVRVDPGDPATSTPMTIRPEEPQGN